MVPRDEYEQIWSGEWWTFDQPFDLACCSCHLVHSMRIRLNEGRIEVQMTERKRETNRLRKKHGITVSRKEK